MLLAAYELRESCYSPLNLMKDRVVDATVVINNELVDITVTLSTLLLELGKFPSEKTALI